MLKYNTQIYTSEDLDFDEDCFDEDYNLIGPRVRKLNSNIAQDSIELLNTALIMSEYTDEQILAVYCNSIFKNQ